MGRIANVLSIVRGLRKQAKVTDIMCDPGGGANITPQQFNPPGDDSLPLIGDFAVILGATGTGNGAVCGYVNPTDEQLAQPGEKRFYARSVAGAVVSSVHMKRDGSITTTNGAGTFILEASGDLNLNGVVIKPDGTRLSTKSIETRLIEVDGKELKDHKHELSGGGTTGPNI